MGSKVLWIILVGAALLMTPGTGSCLDGKDIRRLKEAGISDTTLQMVIREQVVETAALSVDDILSMKEAGISDTTLQMVIRELSFRKDTPYREYGRHTGSVRHVTVGDLMEMKDNGFSDDVLQALIIHNSDSYGNADRERAWRMLTQMGLIVDGRPWLEPTPEK